MLSQGLREELIFEAEFGEGFMDAGCFEHLSSTARVVRRFRLSEPPPASIRAFCEFERIPVRVGAGTEQKNAKGREQ